MKRLSLLLPLLLAAGCGSTSNYLAHKRTTVEMYHIFDVKTAAPTAAVADAVASGLGKNTKSVDAHAPVQPDGVVPDQPGRFSFAAGGAGANTAASTASCDGAAWTARALRSAAFSSDVTLHACLYKYKEGYQLDTYAVFEKTEGGLVGMSRNLASRVLGTPEEWVHKTIWGMVRSVEAAAQAKATHVEGKPQLEPDPAATRVAANAP